MASYKTAVYLMCKSCIYDELDRGTWRQQVDACICYDCPLWSLRPQTSTRLSDKVKATRKKRRI